MRMKPTAASTRLCNLCLSWSNFLLQFAPVRLMGGSPHSTNPLGAFQAAIVHGLSADTPVHHPFCSPKASRSGHGAGKLYHSLLLCAQPQRVTGNPSGTWASPCSSTRCRAAAGLQQPLVQAHIANGTAKARSMGFSSRALLLCCLI